MKNKLCNPITQTYQGISFTQAILLSYGNTKNEIYNNYVNLYIDKLGKTDEFELNFSGVLWEDFRLRGLFAMDIFPGENKKYNFIDLVKKQIRKGKYVYIFGFDDYYVSYSPVYMKNHIEHDLYIYGYDSENFFVMAYKGKNLRKFAVAQKEVENGYMRKTFLPYPADICTVEVLGKRVSLSEKKILDGIECYLNGEPNNYPTKTKDDVEKKAYGVNVYDEISQYLKCLYMTNFEIDLRIFRLLWEHKVMMLNRLDKLSEKHRKQLNEIRAEYSLVEKKAEILFRRAIKFSICNKKELLIKMVEEVDSLRGLEEVILEKVRGAFVRDALIK